MGQRSIAIMLQSRLVRLPGQRFIVPSSRHASQQTTEPKSKPKPVPKSKPDSKSEHKPKSKTKVPAHFYELDLRSRKHLDRFIANKEIEALADLKKQARAARKTLDELQTIIERLENIRIN